jgi:hypothetical protein
MGSQGEGYPYMFNTPFNGACRLLLTTNDHLILHFWSEFNWRLHSQIDKHLQRELFLTIHMQYHNYAIAFNIRPCIASIYRDDLTITSTDITKTLIGHRPLLKNVRRRSQTLNGSYTELMILINPRFL